MYLEDGRVCADVFNGFRQTICSVGTDFADGARHMATHVLGNGGQKLYVDGELRSESTQSTSGASAQAYVVMGRAPQAGTPYLTGQLDEVKIFDLAMSDVAIKGLYDTWQPLTLSSSGAGVLDATWSAPLPENVEGNYQIDLTATDTLGNRNEARELWGQWNGEIDLIPPRVHIELDYTGAGYTARTAITGYAEDLNLVEQGFESPCAAANLTRSYNTLTRPNQATRLNRIDFSCSVAGFVSTVTRVKACDTHGRCAANYPPQYYAFTAGPGGVERFNAYTGGDARRIVNYLWSYISGGLAVDVPRRQVYWVQWEGLRRAKFDGTEVEVLASGSNFTGDLAIDSAAGLLYRAEEDGVYRSNLDGTESVRVLTGSNRFSPLALDPVRGKLYVGIGSNVVRFNYDGSGRETFHQAPQGTGYQSLAVNPATGRVYWSFFSGAIAGTSCRNVAGVLYKEYNAPVTAIGGGPANRRNAN
jgi:hypothetical protein